MVASNFFCCTISVSEGNYDLMKQSFLFAKSNFSGCTISVSEGNYDLVSATSTIAKNVVVALFPFLKGITTIKLFCYVNHCKLHYFRF